MVLTVAERSNVNDNVANAAKLISKSKDRRAVFEVIYHGKKKWKTVTAIAERTGLSKKRVLEEGKKIVDNGFAAQGKVDHQTAYSRDAILYQHKRKLFAAASNKAKLAAIATRVRPAPAGSATIRITLARPSLRPRRITIDNISSFAKVRGYPNVTPMLKLHMLPEERIKKAFKSIIGETHDFKDWGGEKNDLYTNKLRIATARKQAAFAFKGRATKGPLTPKKMGKNGDQVGRLFSSDAEAFFVVYHSKVDESVHNQLHAHAIAKSMGGVRVWYCVIDGDDLNRLHQAYPEHFMAGQ